MTAKAGPGGPRFQIARFLVLLVYGLLPVAISVAGLDKFRTPKDIFITSMIPLLAVACLAAPSFRIRVGTFELAVLVAGAYVLIHSIFLGGVEAAVTVCLFALWLLLLGRLMSWPFQKRVWLVAGVSLSLNSAASVLQYFGKFPWMQGEAGKEVSGRFTPAGFVGEVGSGAILFGLIVLPAIYFLLFEERRGVRVTWAFILICNLTGLLFTRTITASLALAGCLLLWLGFHHWWAFRRARSRRGLVVLWIALLLGLGLSAGFAVQSRLLARVSRAVRLASEGRLEEATGGRYSVYLITWAMVRERPLTGHGLGSFAPVFYHHRTETPYGRGMVLLPQSGAFREAHNEYLQAWADLGLPGVLLLGGLLGLSLLTAVRLTLREADPRRCYWAGILALCTVYFAIASLTMFPLHLSATAIFVTLIMASIRSLDQYGFEEPSGPEKAVGGPRGPLVVVATILALPLLYGQVQKWQANNSLGTASFLLEGATEQNLNHRQRRAVAGRALVLVDDAESRYVGFPELHSLRGSAALLLGRYQMAEESYRKAVERIPSPETMTNLAAALIAQEKCGEAMPYLESALRYNRIYPKAIRARRYCGKQEP